MTTMESTTTATIQLPELEYLADEAQFAAAAFLARYSGRTLDAYRHDLRGFFQWATDIGLAVLDATRPQISCSAARWRNAGSRPQRSTAGCRPCAASIDSLISMGGSRRTLRNT